MAVPYRRRTTNGDDDTGDEAGKWLYRHLEDWGIIHIGNINSHRNLTEEDIQICCAIIFY